MAHVLVALAVVAAVAVFTAVALFVLVGLALSRDDPDEH